MALFVNQPGNRSELQQKLAAELQAKARQQSTAELPDGVEDSQFVRHTSALSSKGWIWIVIALAVIVGIVWLTVATTESYQPQ